LTWDSQLTVDACAVSMKARPRACDDKTAPAHPDGKAAFRRRCRPSCSCFYIEPLLRWIHVGGRGYRSAACPPKTARHQCARVMLTTSTQHKTNLSNRHKTVVTAVLPPGRPYQTVHGDRNAQTGLEQLEGAVRQQALSSPLLPCASVIS
jgi:hypothetical protein